MHSAPSQFKKDKLYTTRHFLVTNTHQAKMTLTQRAPSMARHLVSTNNREFTLRVNSPSSNDRMSFELSFCMNRCVLHRNIVCAALIDCHLRHECELCFFLQFRNSERAAVAHSVRHLAN